MTTTQQSEKAARMLFSLSEYVDVPRLEAHRQALERERQGLEQQLRWVEEMLAQLRITRDRSGDDNGTLIENHGTGVKAKAPKADPRRLPSNKDLIFDILPSDPEQAMQASAVVKAMRKRGWRTSSKRPLGPREVVYQTLKALALDGFVACRRNGHACYWHRAV